MTVADIRTRILKKDREQLADIIISLISKMTEKEKEAFEKDYLGKDLKQGKASNNNSEADIAAAEKFCKECINGAYKIESGTDEYYDFYDEQTYRNRPWAAEFAYYFRLAEDYADADCNDTAYELFSKLFECLGKAKSDYEILGTSEPLKYINVGFDHMFEVYFLVMQKSLSVHNGYLQMLITWELFHDYCTGLMYDFITDLEAANEAFLGEIKNSSCARGEKLLLILTNIYENNNERFDKVKAAEELLSLNSGYSLYAAWSYLENKEYSKAIETANKYMDKVDVEIAYRLKLALIEAYDSNEQQGEAYKACFEVFQVEPNYELYKRMRSLNVGALGFDEVFRKVEKVLLESNNWQAEEVYRYILSYEGMIDKLICIMPKVNSDYQSVKYTARSIVYRAVKGEEVLPVNLSEFISDIIDESLSGVVDIEQSELTAEAKKGYLQKALEIIKEMVNYHIGVDTKASYERAAYYLSVAWDIWALIGEDYEAVLYTQKLLEENKQCQAFKSELKKRFIVL